LALAYSASGFPPRQHGFDSLKQLLAGKGLDHAGDCLLNRIGGSIGGEMRAHKNYGGGGKLMSKLIHVLQAILLWQP
jgi:hypothetical protein